jgi:hypothetical protein
MWENGFRHGEGVFTYKSGDIYRGPFERGRRQGNGAMLFHNGNTYTGPYTNDMREGEGLLVTLPVRYVSISV